MLVQDPRAPIDKSRVFKPDITCQIPQYLMFFVKLHRHQYRRIWVGVCMIEACLGLLRLQPGAVAHGLYIVCASIFPTDGLPLCSCISPCRSI